MQVESLRSAHYGPHLVGRSHAFPELAAAIGEVETAAAVSISWEGTMPSRLNFPRCRPPHESTDYIDQLGGIRACCRGVDRLRKHAKSHAGQTIRSGDVLQIDDRDVVFCSACIRSGVFSQRLQRSSHGLLVRSGVRQSGSRWRSRWEMQAEVQYLNLANHKVKLASLFKIEGGFVEVIM